MPNSWVPASGQRFQAGYSTQKSCPLQVAVPAHSIGAPERHRRATLVLHRKSKQLRFTAASSASGGYAIPHEPADAGLQQSTPDSAAGGEQDAAGKVGFSGALMNVLNILSGVGLLSVPYALRKAGWVGLAVLWLLGIVTNYTGKILVECCQEVAARRKVQNAGQEGDSVGYEDLGEAAYGSLGRKIVTTTMYTELLGICSLLFILEGQNMFKLLGTRLAPSADLYILIAAALMIPTVWLPNLKALSFLGVFGFAATLTVAATVGYTFFTHQCGSNLVDRSNT